MRAAIATALFLNILSGLDLAHAQERIARRVEAPAPYGEGGTLIASVDPYLCEHRSDLVLRVMREDGEDRSTRFNVFETPLTKPCEWVIGGLWPGKYDVALHRDSRSGDTPRQIFSVREFALTAGATVVQTLDGGRIEVAGQLTLDGAPALDLKELRLVFTSPGQLPAQMEVPIDERGEYRATLDADGDYSVVVSGRTLTPIFTRVKIEPGSNRFDVDLPPGVINVTIIPPPNLSSRFRILGTIEHKTAGGSFQVPMDATRTYVILGHGYGRYLIRVGTDALNASQSRTLTEAIVNLTPNDPRQDIVLDVSTAALTPYAAPAVNIEVCPPPRTVACLKGPAPK